MKIIEIVSTGNSIEILFEWNLENFMLQQFYGIHFDFNVAQFPTLNALITDFAWLNFSEEPQIFDKIFDTFAVNTFTYDLWTLN